MARTELDTHVEQHIVTEADAKGLPAMLDEAQQLTVAQTAVLSSFEAIKAIGRIEAAQFSATVSEKLIIETAIKVRESKQYKGLPYVKDGVSGNISTFDEFCEVFLGKTGRRIRDLISNHNLLGEELYEQAERLGFRQRDYNALKALPSDDRQLIAQAIEEENLDKALDLMQEMAAKHVREKEALTKKAEELAHTIEAKDKVIKDKTGVIDTQAEKLALLETKKRNEPAPSPEQRLLDARANLQATALHLKVDAASRLMRQTKELLLIDKGQEQFAAALIIDIKRELEIIVGDCGLPTVIDENPVPEWMRGTEFDPNQEA